MKHRRYNDSLIKGAIQAKHEFIPTLSGHVTTKDIHAINKQKFLSHEKDQERKLHKVRSKDMCLSIGPEGGLTVRLGHAEGLACFHLISPTNSILKAETAAIIFSGMLKIMIELY